MNTSVGFIGVGNMGTAIIKGLAAQNIQVHGCDLDTAKLEALRQWEKERITGCIQAVVEALELKLRDAMPLMFAAISGQASSVSVLDAMEIIGPDLTRFRLRQALEMLGGVTKKETKEWEKQLATIAG